jgi:hypothetical protein
MKTLLRIRTCVEWTLHMFRMAIFLLNEPFGASFIFHLSFILSVKFSFITILEKLFILSFCTLSTFVLQLFQHFL